MIDLNTLFADTLNKAIAAAVEQQTQPLLAKIEELEKQVASMSDIMMTESDVERVIDNIDFRETVLNNISVSDLIEDCDFADAVRDVIASALR